MSAARHLYWSLRRELWENRAVWAAPLAIASFGLFGFGIHARQFTDAVRGMARLADAKQTLIVVQPFGLVASAILATCWLVAIFYSLDSLHGERRDRSILFWKSMPVSDLTTVGAKAIVPLVVLPLVGCVISVVVQALMLFVAAGTLAARDIDAAAFWSRLPILQMPLAMFYGMAVHALWFAPIIGWLMLISAWARRTPFLWAVVPFIAAMPLEAMTFGTRYVMAFIQYRVVGAMKLAFEPNALNQPIVSLAQLTPGTFFSSAGLWVGLAFTAVFLALAVHLRRYREPI